MLHNALHYIAFMSMLVATQPDARIDSDSIFTFLCIGSLRLIAKKLLKAGSQCDTRPCVVLICKMRKFLNLLRANVELAMNTSYRQSHPMAQGCLE